ncbi:MAG: hypothetical protein WAV09_01585, partial [Minisyncoccia bacterium]
SGLQPIGATLPGAAFWVRIGSELATEAAREAWRADFATAAVQATASDAGVEVRATTPDGAVAAGYPGLIDPPYPHWLLGLDGVDVGQQILAEIEPIKSFLRQTATATPVTVRLAGTYWEAEAGVVRPSMVATEDPRASGGRYVWMPAEPGERMGGAAGSASWTLRVPQAGQYHLWARVLSPTPENDSFFVRASRPGETLLDTTDWPLGVHREWAWVRFNPKRGSLTTLSLPTGECTLQLRVREAGAKVDRLFLTRDEKAVPKD